MNKYGVSIWDQVLEEIEREDGRYVRFAVDWSGERHECVAVHVDIHIRTANDRSSVPAAAIAATPIAVPIVVVVEDLGKTPDRVPGRDLDLDPDPGPDRGREARNEISICPQDLGCQHSRRVKREDQQK